MIDIIPIKITDKAIIRELLNIARDRLCELQGVYDVAIQRDDKDAIMALEALILDTKKAIKLAEVQ